MDTFRDSCPRCGAQVFWATVEGSGRRICLDPRPHARANVVIWDGSGRSGTRAGITPDGEGVFIAHRVVCSNRADPRCPTCGSNKPELHPGIGVMGIADPCSDPFHHQGEDEREGAE